MTHVTIRSARQDEIEAVLAMYEWLFEPPGARPPSWDPDRAMAALREAIASDRGTVLVAERHDRLIGLCAAYLDLESVRFGRRCWIEDLAVHPEHRSQGVGAQLLSAAMEWARDGGATHLELDTNVARDGARRFYEGQGPSHHSISYTWPL
jgi:GNAT superfamily N-acetyltransferase